MDIGGYGMKELKVGDEVRMVADSLQFSTGSIHTVEKIVRSNSGSIEKFYVEGHANWRCSPSEKYWELIEEEVEEIAVQEEIRERLPDPESLEDGGRRQAEEDDEAWRQQREDERADVRPHDHLDRRRDSSRTEGLHACPEDRRRQRRVRL